MGIIIKLSVALSGSGMLSLGFLFIGVCIPTYCYGPKWCPAVMYSDTVTWGLNYYQHHVKTYGILDKFGYKEFIPMFKAEKFDANKWVELFKKIRTILL